jgi:uncharacterized protein
VLALAVILTPMFNAARGSILVAALFHFQQNNLIWPDAQPWENYIFAIIAAVIVVANRRAMLPRQGAVTEVLMPAREQADSTMLATSPEAEGKLGPRKG